MPSQLLQHLPNLNISDHNESGIRSYCLLTLEGLDPAVCEGLDISELSRLVATRAEGVFLWARFALEQLLQGHSSGETLGEMSVRLDSISGDIEDIYDRMLGRLEPLAKKECMIMLQLVCFAKHKLLWQELCVAIEIAMEKDVVLTKYICGDVYSTEKALKEGLVFARRLRAKAAGLLEIGGEPKISISRTNADSQYVKLIHKSVRTYLDHKGWRMLGGREEDCAVKHESMYIKTCTRYVRCFLRQYGLEKATSLRTWAKTSSSDRSVSNGSDWMFGKTITASFGETYPFLAYTATCVFEHAEALERHGVSSDTLLQDSMTEQSFCLHYLNGVRSEQRTCLICYQVPMDLALNEEFDAINIAFLPQLLLYCRSDLATRFPAPGQTFWERALSFAIFSWNSENPTSCEAIVSLALRNVTTVQRHHIEEVIRVGYGSALTIQASQLVLQHESVKTLRLTDDDGQSINILWFFTQPSSISTKSSFGQFLSLFIEVANRIEDVRQPCGPEGNVVETLLKKTSDLWRSDKLHCLKAYYESMSWPFEYEPDDIEDSGPYGLTGGTLVHSGDSESEDSSIQMLQLAL